MQKEQVIFKGKYQRPQPAGLMCVKQYLFVRGDDGKKKLTVIANFSGEEVRYPAWAMDTAGEPILGNYDTWPAEGILRPYEAVMYMK